MLKRTAVSASPAKQGATDMTTWILATVVCAGVFVFGLYLAKRRG